MKTTARIIALITVFWGMANLRAAEKWEGNDSFEGPAKWKIFEKQAGGGAKGQMYVLGGQLVYAASEPTYDNAAYWGWGSTRKWTPIPTGRSWEFSQEAIFPQTSPSSTYADVGIGFAIYKEVNRRSYRALWARLKADYSSGQIRPALQAESDFNFEARLNRDGGGPLEEAESVPTGSRRFTLLFRHNALSRMDTFQVKNPDTGAILYDRTDPSTLALAPDCVVGPVMSIDRFSTWPAGSTYLAVDNWVLRSFNPDPINLNSKSGSSRGVAYSVAVSGLGMTGARLTGTVALTVGTNSATLPITGSIDKNGFFVLTGKGTGSAKGFSCALLYNPSTGTYQPNKNILTAPRQKSIRF